MAGVNKAIIVGNLGRDPEMRATQSGTQVANFTVATSRAYNDSNGQRQVETEWHRVVAFGRLAEICGQYLHKGKQVYIEGRLQTRSWEDQQGQKRYTTEVVARDMQMLGRVGDAPDVPSGGGGGGGGFDQEPQGAPMGSSGGGSADDDDLPF